MSLFVQTVLILLFMLASALFSGLETGGYLLNRIRLRFRARQGSASALRLQRALNDTHLFIFTVLIGNNIAVYLLSRQVTQLYLQGGLSAERGGASGIIPWNAETAATLTLMLPLFIFAELLPKNLFRLRADFLMYHCAGILRFFQWLFWPATYLLKGIFRLLTRRQAGADALSGFSLSLEGLREYFSGETLQKTLTDHQHDMIDNLVAMYRIPVRQIMQSWGDAVSISDRSSVRQAVALMQEQNIEQVLLFQGSRRNLKSVVRILDLMDSSIQPEDPVQPLARKMIHISSAQTLSRAFRILRSSPDMPALVIDRAEKAVGILHLRDIAGYIVSES